MKPLYEITSEYKTILDELYNSDELTPESIQALEEIKTTFEDKVISIASFIKNLEVEHNAIDDAINNMRIRRDRIYNKMDRMKEYIRYNLFISNINHINHDKFDISIKNNPPSVEVENENLIPKEYIKSAEIYKVDRESILNDLKNGVIIPGVSLKSKTRLCIK